MIKETKTDCFLKVKVQTPDGKEFKLAGEYDWDSNYAHSQPKKCIIGDEELKHLSDQPSVIQLSYLVKVYGKPLKVTAQYRGLHDWSGQKHTSEDWEIEFELP